MSIDLEIFPTILEFVCWGDVKNRLQKLVGLTGEEFLGKHPALLHLGSNKVVEEDEKLSLNGCYYLSLAISNTLSITVMPNQGNLDELEYLEDYGRNLEFEIIEMFAKRWQTAGYYYSVSSMGGRSKPEPKLFCALATALAYTCDGYVIVMNNDIFDLGVGVYTAEQFQNAEPKF